VPFFLIALGLLLIVTGARNTYGQLGTMVVADMSGSNGGAGFVMYAIAIGGVGALGAVPEMRSFSHWFMSLILLSLILHNASFFQKFMAAFTKPGAATATGITTPWPGLNLPGVTQ
jgi:hypothetical protein